MYSKTLESVVLRSEGGKFDVSLFDEDKVSALDDLFQQQYDMNTAQRYDATLKLQSMVFGCWEASQRKRLVRLLDAPKGGMVLEVAVGTGAIYVF